MRVRLSDFDTIIFDLGQVIVDLQPEKVIERFEALLGRENPELQQLFADTPNHIAYEKGQLTTAQFIQVSNEWMKSTISDTDFIEAWNLMIGRIPNDRLQLMESLKRTHQVLILSNTNEMHEHYFDAQVRAVHGRERLAQFAHQAIYSHKIGLRKPEADIYSFVTRNFLSGAPRALFLDDKLVNVEAAKRAGIEAIQVKYPDQIFEIVGGHE